MVTDIYTFTNAGSEGREGPTQSAVNSEYSGTNLEGKVTINGSKQGYQMWTVPKDGLYTIEAYGAEGGSADKQYSSDNHIEAEKALVKGDFI